VERWTFRFARPWQCRQNWRWLCHSAERFPTRSVKRWDDGNGRPTERRPFHPSEQGWRRFLSKQVEKNATESPIYPIYPNHVGKSRRHVFRPRALLKPPNFLTYKWSIRSLLPRGGKCHVYVSKTRLVALLWNTNVWLSYVCAIYCEVSPYGYRMCMCMCILG
jgi:hypothetical protein